MNQKQTKKEMWILTAVAAPVRARPGGTRAPGVASLGTEPATAPLNSKPRGTAALVPRPLDAVRASVRGGSRRGGRRSGPTGATLLT